MQRPNKSDTALMQALHAYNDAKIVKVIDGGGFTVGKDTVVIEMNRMAFGLFEQSILNAFKERQDLRDRNPEWVADQKECPECKGVGGFPYIEGTPEFNQAYDDFYLWEGKIEEGAPPKEGWKCSKFCSPCQGTGIVLKPQPPRE
jgi:hypothetical protein